MRPIDPVIKELRETLLLMGGRAEAIIEKAVRSLTERNAQLASEIADDDVGPVGREAIGDRATDALGGAGDDDGLACVGTHRCSMVTVRCIPRRG